MLKLNFGSDASLDVLVTHLVPDLSGVTCYAITTSVTFTKLSKFIYLFSLCVSGR